VGERHGIHLANFYRNRALRLLPAVVLVILVVLAFNWLTHEHMHDELVTAAYSVVYLANWQTTWSPHVGIDLSHFWSLAIEEQFYFVWPAILLLFFGLRRNIQVVVAGMTGLIVMIAVRRAWLWNAGYLPSFLYTHTDTRADALLIGALLAVFWVRRLTPTRGLSVIGWLSTLLLLVCIAFGRANTLVYFPPPNGFLFIWGFPLTAIASAGIILAVLDGRWWGTAVLELRPLRALGRVSYGLYLWHVPVFFEVAAHTTTWSTAPRIVLAWSISLALTVASWRLVELRFLRMKRGSQAPALPVPSPTPGA
jgi:peptidoglycan/LPS O-acetylase OafA/YrhL